MNSGEQSLDTPVEDAQASDPVARLLEDSWDTRSRRASTRELISEAAAAALFLGLAATLAAPTLVHHAPDLSLTLLLVGLYALVSRGVKFPIGAGYVVPSYLVLAPMLLLLPPNTVPLLAAAGLVLGTFARVVIRRAKPEEVIFAVPDAFHTLGPAAVLWVAGVQHGATLTGVYLAAFAAGCLIDLITSSIREAVALGIAPRLQLRVVTFVWLVDAFLAPLGVLLARAAGHDHTQLLMVLPLAAVFLVLDHDRTGRIKQARERLTLVGRERTRLQAAVRRLGDAFAAKLDLLALTTIVLQGSVEALDANAGQLSLTVSGRPHTVQATGGTAFAAVLENAAGIAQSSGRPEQCERDGDWALAVPFTVGAGRHLGTGTLAVARPGRRFRPDEEDLMRGLLDRASEAVEDMLSNEEVREQAVTDDLTGLGNRRKLTADLGELLTRYPASSEPRLLMLFDLNGFKTYNDTFGHLAGDALLARLGDKLADAVAPTGTAYRLGGDEFCALLAVDDLEVEARVAAAAAALSEHGETFALTASCGAVLLPHEATTADYALQLADERMYARKLGRTSPMREQTREILVRIMHAKQPGLPDHSTGVARRAIAIGRRLGMEPEQLDELGRAAELHDIGKVGIPDAILDKPAPLDPHEWEFIHQHTIIGERILSAAPALRPIAEIVRASHERWDGRGYPDHLTGEDIPLAARIIAVCDAYDAITMSRSYRAARTDAEARLELQREAGHQFDPVVVKAFLDELDQPAPFGLLASGGEVDPAQGFAREIYDQFRQLLDSESPVTDAATAALSPPPRR